MRAGSAPWASVCLAVAVHGGNHDRLIDTHRAPHNETAPSLEFIHIPKNAGSAITDAALENGIQWGEHSCDERLPKCKVSMEGGGLCSRYHVPPALLPEPHRSHFLHSETMCVTRHPYDRAVSQYVWRLWFVSQTVDKTVFPDDMFGILYKHPPCSAAGLNSYLQTYLTRTLSGSRYEEDCHFVPQSDFIWLQNEQWCDHVLHLEDFPASFNELMANKSLPVRLGAADENHLRGFCQELSTASLAEPVRALLDRVYRDDFDLLGYSPEERPRHLRAAAPMVLHGL